VGLSGDEYVEGGGRLSVWKSVCILYHEFHQCRSHFHFLLVLDFIVRSFLPENMISASYRNSTASSAVCTSCDAVRSVVLMMRSRASKNIQVFDNYSFSKLVQNNPKLSYESFATIENQIFSK
jgi:hypothetical protein